jgi:predicted nucleotidyltransferase
MNLNSVREGELKDVFDALEEAFASTDTDYYIIGALARDIWYSRGRKTFRQTRDVDFAVLVGSQEEYEAVKQYLKENKRFVDTKGNSFVMLTPSGVQVDILPFGEIEIDDGVSIAGGGLSNIKVNGFMEVYQSGTAEVEMQTGHNFKIATLPSIVLLKLIAFDDRPEKRSKDARDIANIIEHFFELQADLIYNNHADLFSDEDDDQTLQEIAARVIGREIKAICAVNESLRERVIRILKTHIDLKEESLFVRNMIAETDGTVEQSVVLLQNILSAFAG